LEIVHRIVTQKYGGRIELESEPGRTRFVVWLPQPAD
jgi:signal transduction histidine kinase